MKKLFLLSSISVFIGLMFLVFCTSQVYAQSPFGDPPKGGALACMDELVSCETARDICEPALGTCETARDICEPALGSCVAELGLKQGELGTCDTNLGNCTTDLGTCDGEISTCNAALTQAQGDLGSCEGDLGLKQDELDLCDSDLAACEAAPGQIFPGDGYGNPDAGGLSGHGPALSYTDNGNGTFTDDNTGFMWEIKDDNGGIHDKDNTYSWTASSRDPNGTLFFVFLDELNTTCDGAGVDACAIDDDCVGSEVCGFAGYQDWRIPNVKELQSIVDYSVKFPSSSVPGKTNLILSRYWSVTTVAGDVGYAWSINFNFGFVVDGPFSKRDRLFARAVRP